MQPDLTKGELGILMDGLTDDVSFGMALIHLEVRGNTPGRDNPPSVVQIDAVFRSYSRLIEAGLLKLGKLQYVDGGPPGRVAPVEHVEEPAAIVRSRVETACRSATGWGDWAFSCWTVNTKTGDERASRAGES